MCSSFAVFTSSENLKLASIALVTPSFVWRILSILFSTSLAPKPNVFSKPFSRFSQSWMLSLVFLSPVSRVSASWRYMSSVDAIMLPTHDSPSYTASARFSSKSSVPLRLGFWALGVGSVHVSFILVIIF